MTSTLMSSMKPEKAAAQPEYEFSIETTTGMSAPPMAATRWMPSSSESTVARRSGMMEWLVTNHQPRTTSAATMPRFSQCRPGSVSGLDANRPLSLPHATIEPVKVTAPMNTPRYTSTVWKASAPGLSR